MRCQSGNHEWIEPISAERCCSGEWHRAMRLYAEHKDLDEQGRTYSIEFVHGWVRVPEKVKA